MDVAVASANRALSSLDLKPVEFSIRRSSSSLKIPLRRPVPIKVPSVSKVSEILNEKMVISTSGSFAGSANRLVSPPSLKIARKVVGSAWHASVKLTVSCGLVTPKGIPTRVVTMMEIRIAPFTFSTSRMIVSTRPKINTRNAG